MKAYAPLIFLLTIVRGNPMGSTGAIGDIADTLFCKVNSVVIEALHKDAAATAFCSSFLSLPPPSTTTTVTVTPSSVYTSVIITATGLPDTVNATVTQTPTAGITVTGIIYETETVTTTTTAPVSLTCLSTAYTATAESTTTAAIQRRGESIHEPVCIPPEWPEEQISKACSCLDLSECDTATVTQTVPPGTITKTYEQTITPTITNTITSTASTATNTISTVVTSTTTVTSVVTATPTVLVPSGARYRKYTHPFQAVTPPIFNATYFKTATPDFTGILENLSFSSPSWPSLDVTLTLADRPGSPFDSTSAALLLQGFFRAPAPGAYLLGTSSREVDNWGYLWVGDVAYAAWDDGNAAFRASGPDLAAPEERWTANVTLGAGDAVPLTWLWANGGGPSQSYFSVTAPDGSTTTDTTGHFVPACGDEVFP